MDGRVEERHELVRRFPVAGRRRVIVAVLRIGGRVRAAPHMLHASVRDPMMRVGAGQHVVEVPYDHVHALVTPLLDATEAYAAYAGIECRQRTAQGAWERLRVFNDPYDPVQLLVENYIPMHAVLFARQLIRSGLRFDETLEVYEDWDFWIQLARLTPLHHLDRITAIYRIANTSGFALRGAEEVTARGYVALMEKWRSRWTTEQLVAIARRAVRPPSQPRVLQDGAPADVDPLPERVARLEDLLQECRGGSVELEKGINERDGRINALAEELEALRQKLNELVALRRVLLRRLDEIQTSASWQLAGPVRAVESRWPGLVRGAAAIPKLAWWALTLRLPQRLRVRNFANELLETRLFDHAWYVENNPDIVLSGKSPLHHWLAEGWAEGRDPNPHFDVDWYLANNPDVAESGINPLAHYLARGASEGRNPNPQFDTGWYVRHNPDAGSSGMNPLVHYLNIGEPQGWPTHEGSSTN